MRLYNVEVVFTRLVIGLKINVSYTNLYYTNGMRIIPRDSGIKSEEVARVRYSLMLGAGQTEKPSRPWPVFSMFLKKTRRVGALSTTRPRLTSFLSGYFLGLLYLGTLF